MKNKTTIQLNKSTLKSFNSLILKMQADLGIKLSHDQALQKLMGRYE
jgi:hypothetical protein